MKRIFYNIKSMFKSSSKTRRNLLLTVVALIEVLLIGIVSTFAWVETISSLAIKTDPSKKSSIAAGAPLSIANVNNTNATIDLAQYFRASGNVHLASASSADGENIFFKNLDAGDSSPAYRKGNINDINVNYISFSFKIKASANDRDFCFETTPTIKIGDNSDVPVRMAISTNTDAEPKVFSTQVKSGSEQYNNVIIDTEGNSSIEKPVAVNSFADYSETGDENIFTAKANIETEVFVSLWLEDPYGFTKYSGDLFIENLKIIPAKALTIHTITNGNESTDGGKVTITPGDISVNETPYVKKVNSSGDSTFYLTATANPGYVFDGWYDAQTGGTKLGGNPNNYRISVASNEVIYARFLKEYNIVATAVTDGSINGNGGSVQVGTATSGSTSNSKANYGDSITLKATAKTGYNFDGWYSSPTGGTILDSSKSNTYTIAKVNSDVNAYARFKVITYTVTAQAVTQGGTAKTGGGTVSPASKSVNYGNSVSFTAKANSGYEFKGWYSDSSCTTRLTTNSTYTNNSVIATSPKNLYAKFQRVIIFTDNEKWGTVYAYFLKGTSQIGAGWPGTKMGSTSGDDYGNPRFKIDVPDDADGVVFTKSSSGPQTEDLTLENYVGFYSQNEWNNGKLKCKGWT